MDVFSLTTEHIKHAEPLRIPIIKSLANIALYSGQMPSQFKIGAILPVHKRKKQLKNPDNHHRIKPGKSRRKIDDSENKSKSKLKQDLSQYGVMEKCSPAICAFMVTKPIAEIKDNDTPLHHIPRFFQGFWYSRTYHPSSTLYQDLDPHLWRLSDFKGLQRGACHQIRWGNINWRF